MTARPVDFSDPRGRPPDFPRGFRVESPGAEVTVVHTRHRRWQRVSDRPYNWQPVSDLGPMPEFERTWAELVDRYDVWLEDPAPGPEEAAAWLPLPPSWATHADTSAATWKRGPRDTWLRLDSEGRETTYALSWEQLQRVPGGVRIRPSSPTGRTRVEHPPPVQNVRPARYYRWEDVKAERRAREGLFDDVEELEPLDAYDVLRGLVVSGDALAGREDPLEYPERSPVRARVPGVGEPDRYYRVVDVNPVRRDGRLAVELLLMPEPVEEGAER